MSDLKPSMRSGFSLLETIIVLSIIGIVAATGFAYMVAARPHARLEQAELLVTSSLQEARQLAISEELATRVVIDQGADTLQVAWQDRDSLAWTNVGSAVAMPEGVTIQAITLSANTARFTPRGTLVTGGALTLQNSTGETTTLTGNVATGRFPVTGGNLR